LNNVGPGIVGDGRRRVEEDVHQLFIISSPVVSVIRMDKSRRISNKLSVIEDVPIQHPLRRNWTVSQAFVNLLPGNWDDIVLDLFVEAREV
jgi:hypothetical protein